MLLKWLFTLLALLWLYQALRPYFLPAEQQKRPEPPPSTPTGNSMQQRRFDDEEGEYIDYEEVKK